MDGEDRIDQTASIWQAVRFTMIDWIINTPPGGFYVGLCTLLIIGMGVDARFHQAGSDWLDHHGDRFISFDQIMLASLLVYKGAGKLIIGFVQRVADKVRSAFKKKTETETEIVEKVTP